MIIQRMLMRSASRPRHTLVLWLLFLLALGSLILLSTRRRDVVVVVGGGGDGDSSFSLSPGSPHYASSVLHESRHKYDPTSTRWQFVVVSDLDERSKVPHEQDWIAYLKHAFLRRRTLSADERAHGDANDADYTYDVEWASTATLRSGFNVRGRGMELSELVDFNGALLACDDRTGLVWQITPDHRLVPRYVLAGGDGEGNTDKPHKCEWMAVKDGALFVGGTGREWTLDDGTVRDRNPQWVKRIDAHGGVTHELWASAYERMRAQLGFAFPGYIIHEAATWHDATQRWYFAPRKVSHTAFDEHDDEVAGSNLFISTSATFDDVRVMNVGELVATHGFSTFKFVPFSSDVLAIKTEEVGDRTHAYLMVFSALDGRVLMREHLIDEVKYEGVEFV